MSCKIGFHPVPQAGLKLTAIYGLLGMRGKDVEEQASFGISPSLDTKVVNRYAH